MFFVAFFLILLTSVYVYFKISHNYWRKKNVPFIPPRIPFGNIGNMLLAKTSRGVQFKEFYNYFKSRGYKYGGIYVTASPVFLVVDPNIIKHVMQTDFDHFAEKNFYINEKDQPIGAHLFAIGGERWKILRQKLTPTFTTGKMKMMFGTLLDCRKPLIKELCRLETNKLDVNIKEIGARFTTDIIGSCAFGIDCNSFEDPDAEFRKFGKKIFQINFALMLKVIFAFSFKDLARKLHVVTLPKDVEVFFTKVVKDSIEYRQENKIERNDFLQLLININNTIGDNVEKITFDEMVAQAFVFFLAGFETSSTTMTYCLFELSQNQDIQNKVREEICKVLKKYEGEISYDCIMEMKYLKQVIDETLRKYPPVPTLDRQCTKDYKVPDTDLLIDKGTSIVIPTFGIQRDPELFPEPDKFDPDRFSEENISNIQPFTYMPFGEGPRVCIGLRFGVMQTKVGLITLLKDYRYTLSKKTNPNITFDQGFILTAKEDILLNIEKVN